MGHLVDLGFVTNQLHSLTCASSRLPHCGLLFSIIFRTQYLFCCMVFEVSPIIARSAICIPPAHSGVMSVRCPVCPLFWSIFGTPLPHNMLFLNVIIIAPKGLLHRRGQKNGCASVRHVRTYVRPSVRSKNDRFWDPENHVFATICRFW